VCVFVGHGLSAAGLGDRPAVGGSVGRVEGRSVGLSTDRGHGQCRPDRVRETPQTQPRVQGKPTQLTPGTQPQAVQGSSLHLAQDQINIDSSQNRTAQTLLFKLLCSVKLYKNVI